MQQQLERLRDLRDRGVLTDEQYERAVRALREGEQGSVTEAGNTERPEQTEPGVDVPSSRATSHSSYQTHPHRGRWVALAFGAVALVAAGAFAAAVLLDGPDEPVETQAGSDAGAATASDEGFTPKALSPEDLLLSVNDPDVAGEGMNLRVFGNLEEARCRSLDDVISFSSVGGYSPAAHTSVQLIKERPAPNVNPREITQRVFMDARDGDFLRFKEVVDCTNGFVTFRIGEGGTDLEFSRVRLPDTLPSEAVTAFGVTGDHGVAGPWGSTVVALYHPDGVLITMDANGIQEALDEGALVDSASIIPLIELTYQRLYGLAPPAS